MTKERVVVRERTVAKGQVDGRGRETSAIDGLKSIATGALC